MSDNIVNVRQYIEENWKSMTFSELISLKYKLDDDGFFTLYARKMRNFHSQNEVKTRNDLFIQMKEMKDSGEHFTLSEMKARNPVLYDELVGQLLTEDEVLRLAQDQYNKYNTASDMLLGQIDNLTTTNLYYALVEKEGESATKQQDLSRNISSNDECASNEVNESEKELLKNEFISQMECHFLSGSETSKPTYVLNN